MIRACFFTSKGKMCGFEISGHAEYADEGSDIVCASVSSAVQMAANTITDVIGEKAVVIVKGSDFKLRLTRCARLKSRAARSVITGLRSHLSILSKQFDGTINIVDSEV